MLTTFIRAKHPPMTPGAVFFLCCPRSGLHLPIARSGAVLGRSAECDLVLDHPSVSRRHAALRPAEQGLEVEDLGSLNGTFAGDERLDRRTVFPGQPVRFGSVAFVVALGSGGAEPATQVPGRAEPVGRELDDWTSPLSAAQRRVFRLLVEGLPDKVIARELALSPHTVHNHTRAIFRLLGVHSRGQLLAALAKRVAHRPRDSA